MTQLTLNDLCFFKERIQPGVCAKVGNILFHTGIKLLFGSDLFECKSSYRLGYFITLGKDILIVAPSKLGPGWITNRFYCFTTQKEHGIEDFIKSISAFSISEKKEFDFQIKYHDSDDWVKPDDLVFLNHTDIYEPWWNYISSELQFHRSKMMSGKMNIEISTDKGFDTIRNRFQALVDERFERMLSNDTK